MVSYVTNGCSGVCAYRRLPCAGNPTAGILQHEFGLENESMDLLRRLTGLLQGPMSAPYSVKLARQTALISRPDLSDACPAAELQLGRIALCCTTECNGHRDSYGWSTSAVYGPSQVEQSRKRDSTRRVRLELDTRLLEAGEHCDMITRSDLDSKCWLQGVSRRLVGL